MTRALNRTLIPLLLALLGSATFAQAPTRLAVLTFDTDAASSDYRLGLATGLQRALNVIDNVYVPPVGDTLVLAQNTDPAQLDTSVFADAFEVQALVSGLVSSSGEDLGEDLAVTLFFADTEGETRRVTVEGTRGDLAGLLKSVTDTVVDELGLALGANDQAELDAVTAQVPPLEDLAALGEISLGLGGEDSSGLQAAAAAGSSWALSERAKLLAASGNDEEALQLSLSAIQAAPSDVEALVNRGVVLAASGDLETARTAFAAALELNPAHAIAHAGRARLATDGAQAESDLEAALAAYPRYAAAYLELAARQRQSGQPQTALQTLRTGAEKVPDSASLGSAFVTQAIAGGNTGEALNYIEASLETGQPAPERYALASALPAEEAPRALAILRQGRAAYPRDSALALAEADMLGKIGDYAEAERVLREAQGFAPNNPELANQLALAQAEQGKTDEAAATLNAASQTNPDLTATLERNLAQIYLNAGQNEAAVTALEPLLEASPEDSDLYTLYGVALGRAGRFDQALNALDEALRLEPDNAQAQQARRFLSQNEQLASGSSTELEAEAARALQAGISALEAGDNAQAKLDFDRAAELQPTGLTNFYKGYIRQVEGDLRGAVSAYEVALEGFPNADAGQARVLNNAGFAYFRLGRLDKAIDYLTRATEADPANSEAQLNLGLIYYDLGRFDDALAPLERALEANPDLAGRQVNTGSSEPLTFAQLLDEVKTKQ